MSADRVGLAHAAARPVSRINDAIAEDAGGGGCVVGPPVGAVVGAEADVSVVVDPVPVVAVTLVDVVDGRGGP